MPYKSVKQRAFMHANHPEIASRWDKKYGGKVQKNQEIFKALSPKTKHRIETGVGVGVGGVLAASGASRMKFGANLRAAGKGTKSFENVIRQAGGDPGPHLASESEAYRKIGNRQIRRGAATTAFGAGTATGFAVTHKRSRPVQKNQDILKAFGKTKVAIGAGLGAAGYAAVKSPTGSALGRMAGSSIGGALRKIPGLAKVPRV